MIYTGKYIFVHVPKTGGSSISAALMPNYIKRSKHKPLFAVDQTDRFAFGFVRNPWSRMVSLYRFHCQKPPLPRDQYSRDDTVRMGFKTWLTTDHFYMFEDPNRDIPPLQRRPQLWWLEGADFVGRFENFEADFFRAAELAGVRPVEALGHIFQTTGGDWRDEYDAESRAFVAKHFAPDIERFGYKCE